MRLLFAHPAVFTGANHHGAIKSYRALIAALAGEGHECDVVALRSERAPAPSEWSRLSSVRASSATVDIRSSVTRARGATPTNAPSGVVDWLSDFGARAEFYALLRRRISELRPDWVICENGSVNLRALLALAGDRLVLSVSTAASLPFGPRSASPSIVFPHVYGRAGKIFCASRFIADYVREHARVDAFVQPQVAYGTEPFAHRARFEGAVAMVNPAAHKGGSIFAALAKSFPAERFRAIESYARPVPELRTLPNVELVRADDDLDRVLSDTKLLLVPSLWGEGFGMVCVDAMLRGIPVVASNDGGLAEAVLGAGDLVPVVPGRLRRKWNGELSFTEPPLDLAPWRAAIAPLLHDRAAWSDRSARSEAAALAYVRGLSVDPLCERLAR